MDPRDIVLQSVVQTIMVPKFGELSPMVNAGHRLLVGSDGLWVEVKRSWLSLRMPIAEQSIISIPYGEVEPLMCFDFGQMPSSLLRAFIDEARKAMPIECAGWIVWNRETKEWRLQMMENISAGAAHVKFHRPALAENEELVIDIHSHGKFGAFFSKQDDRDDAGEVKVSIVVGNCDREEVSVKVRLCALGLYLPLPAPEMMEATHG